MKRKEKPGFHGLYRSFMLEKSFYTVLAMTVCLGMLANATGSAERSIQLSYLQHQSLLDPVTSFELFGGPDYQALPIQGELRAETLFAREISRMLPSVWQIRVPEQISPGSILVNYQLTAANGNAGRLSNTSFPKAEISVNLQPLPPRIIEQEELIVEEEAGADAQTITAQTPPSKRIVQVQRINVIEGGVVLSFHPSQIQYAGTYAGTLTILIHGL